jgi:hypothetical protein
MDMTVAVVVCRGKTTKTQQQYQVAWDLLEFAGHDKAANMTGGSQTPALQKQ